MDYIQLDFCIRKKYGNYLENLDTLKVTFRQYETRPLPIHFF